MKRLSPVDRRRAVDAVRAGESVSAVAKRYGVTRQAVASWVERAANSGPTPPPVAASPPQLVAPPPAQIPVSVTENAAANNRFERAMEAATGSSQSVPSPAPAPAGAAQDDEFCLEVLGGLKETALNLLIATGRVEDVPPVRKAAKLGTVAEAAIRANAAIIAPDLRKHLASGWSAVAVALAIDAMVTLQTIRPYVIKPKREPEATVPAPVAAA